ncbi:MAG: sigma-70 family RNA polymerase sigma factor [Bacteroidota bacterium]
MARPKYSDEEIYEGIKSREDAIILYIYKQFFRQAEKIATKHNVLAEVEDIFQEALVAVYNNIHKGKYTQMDKFKSYFLTTVRNLCLKEVRKKNRKINPEEWTLDSSKSLEDRVNEMLEEQHQIDLSLACLEKLGRSCQEILERYYLNGEKLKDIGLDLRYTEQAIRTTKSRCMKRLVKCVEASLEG